MRLVHPLNIIILTIDNFVKNYWLDRRKERENKSKKENKYIYPKSLWFLVQKNLNKKKTTGP